MRPLARFPVSGLPAILGWACLACAPSPEPAAEIGLFAALQQAGFVPLSDRIDLRGSTLPAADHPLLWRPLPLVAEEGWGPARRGWQPLGDRATAALWRRTAAAEELLLDLRNGEEDASAAAVRIRVSLGGHELGVVEASPGRSLARLPLPPGALASPARLELGFEPPVDSSGRLALLRLGVLGRGDPGGEERGWRLDPQSETAVFETSGALVMPLDLPPSADELAMRARLRGEGLAALRLFAFDARGERRDLASIRLPADEWSELRSPLTALRGSSVILVVETELPGAGQRLELHDLRLRLSGPPAVEDRPPARRGDAAGRRPDVVLVILDAARGDRFPGWDYPRDTIPNLRRLAERALAFRRAFAECPTTSCSIPALISGVALLGGGQVDGGRHLSDEVVTLAEALRGAGYRTVAFSATPNNSAARSLDQGFDEFRELWGRDNPDHGPSSMSRLASEVLRAQPTAVPLYLQLHYLPPHQPYAPGPEFDRFTDPAYDGPIRPRMSLKPYSLGVETLAGKDLEHLIGLYDGNLLRADAAVAEVFETMRDTGRWDDALVVVTSDHGEAFMEHGRQGHNTTLYDEMLHVPLLIRLPRDERPAGVDGERLASLLDVVPTVLGRLGIAAPPEVDGVDLIGSPSDPRRPRLLLTRTSHPEHPMLAARTRYWKAIAWPRHQLQMLFDLERDPGEHVNRVGERPWVYAGMGLTLRRRLRAAAAAAPEQGAAVELTPAAEEALRALGYLE